MHAKWFTHITYAAFYWTIWLAAMVLFARLVGSLKSYYASLPLFWLGFLYSHRPFIPYFQQNFRVLAIEGTFGVALMTWVMLFKVSV